MMLETPAFTSPKYSGSLNDFLKDQVYAVLKLFQSATKGEPFATWEQYRNVMMEATRGTTISEQEISTLWGKHSLNNERFFYQETLKQYYAQGSQVHPDT
jgi:hypothetical protein